MNRDQGVSTFRLAGELALTVVGVLIAIRVATRVPFLQPYSSTLSVLLFLGVPIWWQRTQPSLDLGIDIWHRPGYDFKIFMIVSSIVFPIYVMGSFFYHSLIAKNAYLTSLHLGLNQPVDWQLIWSLPPGIPKTILTQFLAVGLPEEFFYRGYLQTRLEQSFGQRWSCFGVRFGVGALLATVIFALGHSLVVFRWWHIFIVFPGFFFAWLRLKTGTVLAGSLFHAACNLLSFFLANLIRLTPITDG